MSCYLQEGGLKAIFPVRPSQIDRLMKGAVAAAGQVGFQPGRIDHRFGAVMKPDGTPIYLATWVQSPVEDRWTGGFYTEMGHTVLHGTVTTDPRAGTMETSAKLDIGGSTVVEASWTIRGPAAGSDPMNVAGMMVRLTITNAGPHDADCLKSCLTLHAPECVPLVAGSESRTVACAAAVAASCLVNCRC
ncbi:MAG: hypothetical protein HYR51_01700 [Candidatus Rokubacteria bacterium]|nr:hypothetical protein [Candidatus Rokubacteria bacterium]